MVFFQDQDKVDSAWSRLERAKYVICEPLLFFFRGLCGTIETPDDSEKWRAAMVVCSRNLDDCLDCMQYDPPIHPERPILELGVQSWVTSARVLHANFTDWCEQVFSPFMEKYGFLVFTSLAACVALGLGSLFWTSSDSVIVDNTGLPKKQTSNFSSVDAQSLAKGNKYQLPRVSVDGHSLPRGERYVLPRAEVSVHSLPRGERYQLPRARYDAHSLPHGNHYQLPKVEVMGQSNIMIGDVYSELFEGEFLSWFIPLLKFTGNWSDFEPEFLSKTVHSRSRDLFRNYEGL
jgi:hypothetical protein